MASHQFNINIDNSKPQIVDNQAGDDAWRNSSGNYNVDFADNNALSSFQICAWTGPGQTGAQKIGWTNVATNINSPSYIADWQLPANLWAALQEGKNYISIRVYDSCNNSSEESDAFYVEKDMGAPSVSISMVNPLPFNQLIENANIIFSLSDLEQSISAEVKIEMLDGSMVKQIRGYDNGSINIGNALTCQWDGKNMDEDYVGEGNYKVKIRARDMAGNESGWVEYSIIAQDDQLITNNSVVAERPVISINDSGIMTLSWIDGYYRDDQSQVKAVFPTTVINPGIQTREEHFFLNFPQDITITSYSEGGNGYARHSVYEWSGPTIYSYESGAYGQSGITHIETRPVLIVNNYGVDVTCRRPDVWAYTQVDYKVRIFQKYSKICSGHYAQNIVGSLVNGPIEDASYSVGPISLGVDSVKVEGNQIWYKRGSSSWIKLTSISSTKANPSLAVDGENNSYVAWEDNRLGNKQIYFQKIPANYAPLNGTTTVMIASINSNDSNPIIPQSVNLVPPTLIAPEKDKQNVASIRPVFEWKHHRSGQLPVTSYQLDIAKNDTFSIAHQSFSKAANAGSPDKTDANLYYFNYAIHEFDPGLDKDTYYWKVTALSTAESATSEVWSFRIQPDLTLTGVTNFPNPFNPNREKTKIRYRLSTDADEVKIRIYDIAGSLVTELDGTTIGEGSSVWDKYNDVEWDGRNGRGGLVMNGIYPFEITARLGDKTLSGRGKVAVLK